MPVNQAATRIRALRIKALQQSAAAGLPSRVVLPPARQETDLTYAPVLRHERSGYDGLAAVVASKTFRGGQHRNGVFRRLEKLAPAKTQISGSGSRNGGNSLSP